MTRQAALELNEGDVLRVKGSRHVAVVRGKPWVERKGKALRVIIPCIVGDTIADYLHNQVESVRG